MSRLEEKLIELGYKQDLYMWTKDFEGGCFIYFTILKTTILNYGVSKNCFINEQQDIDNLQQALNVMKKDFEVLSKFEKLKGTNK